MVCTIGILFFWTISSEYLRAALRSLYVQYNVVVNLWRKRNLYTNTKNTAINQLSSIYWKRFCLNKFILYTSSYGFLFWQFFIYAKFSFWIAFRRFMHSVTRVCSCLLILFFSSFLCGIQCALCAQHKSFYYYIREKTWNIKQALKYIKLKW